MSLPTVLLVPLVAASFLALCGVNIYLVITLIRGVRIEDSTVDRLSRQSGYMIAELQSLARYIRGLPRGGSATEPAAPAAAGESAGDPAWQAGFEEFFQTGFQQMGQDSLDAHTLVQEMTALRGKELEQWKAANEGRIQHIIAAQAGLHGKLMEARHTLDDAHDLIRELQGKNQRLQGADARAKALDGINHSLEAELALAKSTIARLNGKLLVAQQGAEAAEREMARREASYREQFDAYVSERQQLEKERQATELRFQSLQKAFDQSIQQLNENKLLQEEHEKFQAKAQGIQQERADMERQLNELQESFDRALVEKAFIESVLLDIDSALDPATA